MMEKRAGQNISNNSQRRFQSLILLFFWYIHAFDTISLVIVSSYPIYKENPERKK